MLDSYLPIILVSVLLIIIIVWLIVLELRLKRLFAGKGGVSLEDIMKDHTTEIKALVEKGVEDRELLEVLQKKFTKSIQGIGIVRFNPFHESGGSHSFAIAMIDENDDGVIISTLYSRERTNVFAKPIKNGSSEIELSGEEAEALKQARDAK